MDTDDFLGGWAFGVDEDVIGFFAYYRPENAVLKWAQTDTIPKGFPAMTVRINSITSSKRRRSSILCRNSAANLGARP
jgi:hypothetical protein